MADHKNLSFQAKLRTPGNGHLALWPRSFSNLKALLKRITMMVTEVIFSTEDCAA